MLLDLGECLETAQRTTDRIDKRREQKFNQHPEGFELTTLCFTKKMSNERQSPDSLPLLALASISRNADIFSSFCGLLLGLGLPGDRGAGVGLFRLPVVGLGRQRCRRRCLGTFNIVKL